MEHNINTTSKRDFSDEYFSNPEKPRLDFLWLEITNKCNLKCVHCYAESSQVQPIYQTISLDGWKNIIYDAYFYGCKRIQFIGGEVTISPYLIPLLEYANELGFSFKEIYTNGTVMSDDLLNLIKKINANLAFSLYSHDSLTHDLITQRKGSWAKTLASIKKCLYLYIPFRVGIVVMEENKEQLSETRDFLYSLGVKHISIDRIRGIGRGKNLLNSDSPIDELCGNCWKGKLCVSANGDIYPCVFSRFVKIGNYSDGLLNLLTSKKLYDFRKTLYLKSKIKLDECDPWYECDPDEQSCDPHCTPECSPEATCAPEFGHDCDPDDPDRECSPYTGGCSPNE